MAKAKQTHLGLPPCPLELLRWVLCYRMRKNDHLETPEWVWSMLGQIDLDPCAGPETRIGKTNYALSRGENGLLLPWDGFVYCNPPFSQKSIWVGRMKEHGNGIVILPERGSAPWFGPLALYCRCYFVMGQKINFIGGPSSNNLGSVLFPFGIEAIKRLVELELPGHLVEVKSYRHRPAPQLTCRAFSLNGTA